MKAKFVSMSGEVVEFVGGALMVLKASEYAFSERYELVGYDAEDDNPFVIIVMAYGSAKHLELPWPAEAAVNAREDVIALASRDFKAFLDNAFHLLVLGYKIVASN